MIRIPWRRDPKGPDVVEVTPPGGEPQYLSAAGIRDEGPMVDKITEAAQFESKGDAKYFAHLAGKHLEHGQGEEGVPPVDSKIKVVTENAARDQGRNDDWLKTFEQEAQDREQQRDQDQDRGV